MKSVNYALRKAYVAALAPVNVDSVNVPVYYLTAPDSYTGNFYITLNSVSNADDSTKNSSDTNTSMQVQIHTWSDSYNAGQFADVIAGQVFEYIYPNSQAVLDLSGDGVQMVSTKLDQDLVNEMDGLGNRMFVTRILTFSHNIFHKN